MVSPGPKAPEVLRGMGTRLGLCLGSLSPLSLTPGNILLEVVAKSWACLRPLFPHFDREKGAGRQGGTHGAPPCGMGGLEKEGGVCHGEGQGPPRRPHGARVGEWQSPGGAPSPPGGTGRWPGCG